MKLLLLALFFASNVYAATCSTTSRTNYTSGQVLTSSALNADFNQLVTKANAFDGGCVTDGTLEKSALNTTDFAAVNNGIHQGCTLSYVDANTVGVEKCITTIGGNYVKTTSLNIVTWGCTDCSSQADSTQYYLYAKASSTGTTLNLLISTTAPGADGYDGSGNKILGKFFNDYAGNILRPTIISYSGGTFAAPDSALSINNSQRGGKVFGLYFYNTTKGTACTSTPCDTATAMGSGVVNAVSRAGTGSYSINLAVTIDRNKTFCTFNSTLSTVKASFLLGEFGDAFALGTAILFDTINTSTLANTDTDGLVLCFTE